jgi:hypothetical protein
MSVDRLLGYGDDMVEHVEVLDLGVVWEPNAPEAILACNDHGRAVLALNPHGDDPDRRCVVLVWTGARSACLASPNDEAISGHRLYQKGLDAVLWAGRVIDSEAIRALEHQNRVHPRHDPSRFEGLLHHVVLSKERVAEVIATTLSIRRLDGPTLDAATAAMHE